ncbi:MAG: hypothetical protein HYR63_03460 [Proteobacteria bacterium]|nr:hypothetical protein [Pseudomonadota bacterium]MBI3498701.1 hypothetical protein [Pseudomonadota bacterium]
MQTQSEVRYWVLGGEFADSCFKQIVAGTEAVFGPFDRYEAALAKWRECALATRVHAQVRFSIATEGG